MERLLTKTAVADILGIHPASLMRHVREGKFVRPIKVGRMVRFRADDIRAYLDEKSTEARTGRPS